MFDVCVVCVEVEGELDEERDLVVGELGCYLRTRPFRTMGNTGRCNHVNLWNVRAHKLEGEEEWKMPYMRPDLLFNP